MSNKTHTTAAKANNMNPPESSTAGVGDGGLMKFEDVAVPAEIIAENHRRAYAMAYCAAFNGRKLAFVHPTVRNSIARGWFDGEAAKKELDAFLDTLAKEHAEEEAAAAMPF